MDIITILTLVWMHAVADFIFQTDKMAVNKGKSNLWLSAHVGTYIIPFMWFGLVYAVVNAVLHWITDWITARISGAFNQRGKTKAFFITIGIDQAIHMTTLFGTYVWLIQG